MISIRRRGRVSWSIVIVKNRIAHIVIDEMRIKKEPLTHVRGRRSKEKESGKVVIVVLCGSE